MLTGGYGSVAGTALGALSLGMARQGIVFADINADWYKIAIGTLLLVAVVLNAAGSAPVRRAVGGGPMDADSEARQRAGRDRPGRRPPTPARGA